MALPQLQGARDAIVGVDAVTICGTDLALLLNDRSPGGMGAAADCSSSL